MCGIAGVLTFDGRPVRPTEVSALTDAQSHRGRDSAGVIVGGSHRDAVSSYAGVGLGHRRLSIIDLSEDSAQPMRSADRNLCITYNGELYNYRALRGELTAAGQTFRTESDTEVVLAAYAQWGEGCLNRFNGMYAFAIWDEVDQSLFCARDPLGIKPFYYRLAGGCFKFASEGQALTPPGERALNPEAVYAFLLSMYVPGHLSIFAGVQKLLPGRLLRVRRTGSVETKRFWSLDTSKVLDLLPADAANLLQAKLDGAVAAQLRSDVPVGALLSGGFDSGMVVASAARCSVPLHTYSAGFDDQRQVDELPIARSMAQRYGTIHRERRIRTDEVLPLLERAIGAMSEPVADSAIVPTFCLSQMAAEDGVKVLLSGTGGDEIFAGYGRYVGSTAARTVLLSLPDRMRKALANTVAGRSVLSARLRHRSIDMLMNTGGSSRLARLAIGDNAAFARFLEELATQVLPRPDPASPGLSQHMQFDLQAYLPDLLLFLLDQLTMAHTVEGRVPLLDVGLVEACFSQPPDYHATGLQTKLLMRRMAATRLDPRTLEGPKQGFSGPVVKWTEDRRDLLIERVRELKSVACLENLPFDQLLAQDPAGHDPRSAAEVFSLYCLSVWHQAHLLPVSSPACRSNSVLAV
jgi:asparagine synthase (glutamine-hydrolysing)